MPPHALGLFLVSAATLCLEILQTKIFAYSLESLTVYTVVSVALLGFGASGTLLSLLPRAWSAGREGPLAARLTLLAALSVAASHWVFARWSEPLNELEGATAVGVLLALFLPYFLLGAVVAVLLRGSARVHVLYAVNMAGSGIGCLMVFPLLTSLGAPALVLAIAAFLAASALTFVPAPAGTRILAAVCAAGLVLLVPHGDELLPFQPDPKGQTELINRWLKSTNQPPMERLHHAWDPTGQIEVHRMPGPKAFIGEEVDCHFFGHDGSAGSILLGIGDDSRRGRELFENSPYGAAYQARGIVPGAPCRADGPDVLVIGLGGSPDMQAALHFGARTLVGVEINSSTIRMVKEVFKDFLGDPYNRPCVEVLQADGRNFLRRDERKFDVIQLTGVDTKQALASGSLAVNENYLYTLEATKDLLAHLKPGGIVNMIRFGALAVAREVATFAQAMRERGVAEPHKHLCVFIQGMWTVTLAKNEPFTDEEQQRIVAWWPKVEKPVRRVTIPPYEPMDCGLYPRGMTPFIHYMPVMIDQVGSDLFKTMAKGTEQHWLHEVAEDALWAVTDDKPFFFDHSRPSDLWRIPPKFDVGLSITPEWSKHMNRISHYLTFGKLLLLLAGLGAVLILLPALLPRGAGFRALGSPLLYFGALGLGFILVEVGLMQKFVLFLGHTTYSVTVVLLGLLLFAGCGAALAPRFGQDPAQRVRRAAVMILLVSVIYAFALDPLFLAGATLPLGARIGVVLAILLPLALPMGVPFPTGLALVGRTREALLPFSIGINGFFSVMGSVLCLPILMLVGFRTTVLIGAACYLLPLLLVGRMQRRAAT